MKIKIKLLPTRDVFGALAVFTAMIGFAAMDNPLAGLLFLALAGLFAYIGERKCV